mmetsp:Transcript_28873/g.56460  ORF Transcript_28873/g.56460 Transcript_28873/m.56460 type:complete len:456 (+) Transcript_28873:45-1412(+)
MFSAAECQRRLRWERSLSLVPSSTTLCFDPKSCNRPAATGRQLFASRPGHQNQRGQHVQQLWIPTTQANDRDGIKRQLEVHRLGWQRVTSRHELPHSGIKPCLVTRKFQTNRLSNILPRKDHTSRPAVPLLHMSRLQPSTASRCAQNCFVSSLPCSQQLHKPQQQRKLPLQACVMHSCDLNKRQFEDKALIKECAVPGHALACALSETVLFGCTIRANMPSRRFPKNESDALPWVPASLHNDVRDPIASVDEQHACGTRLIPVKTGLASSLQPSAAFNRGRNSHDPCEVPPLPLRVAAGFEAAARGSPTQPFMPASCKQPGTSANTGTKTSLRSCKDKGSPSHVYKDQSSTKDVTKHGDARGSLTCLAIVDSSVSGSSTALESDDDYTCSSNAEKEDNQEDEEDQLNALRQCMARLKASLGQERGDAHIEPRLHALAAFATLQHGLEVLDRAENT